jgi:hypothetical protein
MERLKFEGYQDNYKPNVVCFPLTSVRRVRQLFFGKTCLAKNQFYTWMCSFSKGKCAPLSAFKK